MSAELLTSTNCEHGGGMTMTAMDPTASFSFDENDVDVLTKPPVDWSTALPKAVRVSCDCDDSTCTRSDGCKGHLITRLFENDDDDDPENECLARTPTEVAASIFRPQQQQEGTASVYCSISAELSSNETQLPPLGNLMDSLWDYYQSTTSGSRNGGSEDSNQSEDDDFEPIPLQLWLARGAPVANGPESCGDENMDSDRPNDVEDRCDSHLARPTSHQQDSQSPLTLKPVSEGLMQQVTGLHYPAVEERLMRCVFGPSCISPDRSGAPCDRKRKENEEISDDQDIVRQQKRIKLLPDVIGPEAPQMAPIHRFLEYLKSNESTLETYDIVQTIVTECSEKHVRGTHKCKNLPGAIFERVIKKLGGPDFQRLFESSQENGGGALVEGHATKPRPASSTPEADYGDAKCQEQSLLEIAVGYGFHLARIHFLHDNGASSTVEELLQQGVDTVNRMSHVERAQFWKYMIETPLYQRQTTERDQ
ncbi:hypothetical protein ACA910_013206 [Epithemia clementina (nom. ined.)]